MGLQLPKAKVLGKWSFVIAAVVSIYAHHSVCWFPGLPGFVMVLRTVLVIFCAAAFEFPIISGLGACGVQRFCGMPLQAWDNSIFVKFWFRTIVYMALSLFWISFISADSESQADCKDANGAAVAFFLITCLCYVSAIFLNEAYDPRSDPSPASLFDCAVAYNLGGDCLKTGTSAAAVHPQGASDFDDFYTPWPDVERALSMFHGTRLEHYHSILRDGFIPSSDGMLGRGVYVSRQIEKAYAYGPGKYGSDGVVIEVLVRVGRTKKIDRQGHPLQKSWHDAGYDTAYVPRNCGMVASGLEEDCVWDPARISVVRIAMPGRDDHFNNTLQLDEP